MVINNNMAKTSLAEGE